MAISVAVLVGSAQSWLPELVQRASKLNVNGGFEDGADLYVAVRGFIIRMFILSGSGPLISPAAKQRVTGLIASSEEEGGRIHLDGREINVPGYPHGNFVGPTIIEAQTTMRCYRYVH
jgi:malonate-semialdehyde dehydrogenase (acetylating) / methylmalonate-semialdehyde dehydrogenase